MRILSIALFSLVFVFSTATSAVALSPPLNDDEPCDCPDNYICETDVIEVCEAAPIAPCEDGDEDCTEVNDSTAECYDEVVTSCVPPSCDTDSDCGGDTVCVEYVYETCSGGSGVCTDPAEPMPEEDPDCEEGEDCATPEPDDNISTCEAPEPADCELSSERYCVPPYVAPCDEDADCGPGFDCTFDSGGGCVDSPGDDEPLCEEEPSDGPGHCTMERQECQVDADCGFDFVCHHYDQPTGCGGEPAPAPGDGSGDDDADDNAEEGGDMTDCAAPEPSEGFCAPEDYYRAPSAGGSHGDDPRSGDTGTVESEPPGAEEGEVVDSFRIWDDEDEAGQQSSCATVTGGGGAPAFVLLALLAGLAAIRRQN